MELLPRVDLRSLLTRAEAAAPVGVVDAMAEALREMLGAHHVSFLIADFSGRSLNRLGYTAPSGAPGSRSEESAGTVPLSGSPYGTALATQRSVVLREGGDTRVIAPVTSRGEAVGVLELVLPFDPEPETLEDVELAAHQLAYMIIANRRYTDLFEWGQRTVPVSLAAEIQRRLLPASYTCEADQFTLAGWCEPAGDVGGDTFDFSLDRNTLHMSMTDAMGHSVGAALLATLVVGALRNTRRRSCADCACSARSPKRRRVFRRAPTTSVASIAAPTECPIASVIDMCSVLRSSEKSNVSPPTSPAGSHQPASVNWSASQV